MIILQTGVPGSGKTSSVVALLMNDESYTHYTDKDGVEKNVPCSLTAFLNSKLNIRN